MATHWILYLTLSVLVVPWHASREPQYALCHAAKLNLHPRANGSENGPLDHLQTFKSKPRVFILSDILNEPDDTMSLIRYLLYSNEFDTRGLVATTSTWLRNATHPEEMERLVTAYGSVVDNLNNHVHPDFQYPAPEDLLSLIRTGPKVFGRQALNQTISEGAELLVQRLQESEEPLYVCGWGGVNTLAQALQHIQATNTEAETANLVSRLRVYTISDQDDTGPWIRIKFPDVRYVASIHAWNMYQLSTWSGISSDVGTAANFTIVQNPWLDANIRLGQLGSLYPQVAFLMEGDTPSFLYLIQNGLNAPEHPDWGGWGGRYGRITPGPDGNHYVDTEDRVIGLDGELYVNNRASIWRWRDAYQSDFAARMRWTLTPNFSDAQHPPVVRINGEPGPEPLLLQVTGNQTLTFDAGETYDPANPDDNSHLDYQWLQYWDPSLTHAEDYPDGIGLSVQSLDPPSGSNGTLATNDSGFRKVILGRRIQVTLPAPTGDYEAFHLVLQVTSNTGNHPLRRYKRIVLSY